MLFLRFGGGVGVLAGEQVALLGVGLKALQWAHEFRQSTPGDSDAHLLLKREEPAGS